MTYTVTESGVDRFMGMYSPNRPHRGYCYAVMNGPAFNVSGRILRWHLTYGAAVKALRRMTKGGWGQLNLLHVTIEGETHGSK